jgi:hypothetical protein
VPPRSRRIGKRIGGYVSMQPLGLVALILVVLGGGSAYAAGQLAKNSVKSKHIGNGAVKAVDLHSRAVTTKKLANGAVTVTKLGTGAVTVTKIGDGQVTGAKIADGSVSGAKIADGSVSGAEIADGQVTGADVADGTIGASDLDSVTVGDVKSAAGTLASGAPAKDILAVDGLGVLRANCTFPNTMGFFYALNSPVQQRARAFGHDPIDNGPSDTVGITATAGGVGYGGPLHQLLEGHVWASTADRLLWIDISIDSGCVYRVRATLDRNDAPP